MKYFKYYLIFLAFFLTSCYKDVDDVTIAGIISESITEKPLENVKVSIICWKYGNTPDGSYTAQDSVTVITDKKGNYNYKFDKGAFIEIKTAISGYQNKHESTDITTKSNTMNLKLQSSNK